MYSRFLIPLLKSEIDKAIYLDSDLIVLKDIKKLYSIDLENKPIGAVPHFLKYKKNPYFNSGVLLIDCKKWRQERYIDKLLELGKNYKNGAFPDQDILNDCFKNNYKILDNQFNLLNVDVHWRCSIVRHPFLVLKLKNKCIVRHYCGKHKPWNVIKINSWKFKEWWRYCKMTPCYGVVKQKYKENNKNIIKLIRNKF
jgi:lipopolysaccharide biosynthesis glycosyltransferase